MNALTRLQFVRGPMYFFFKSIQEFLLLLLKIICIYRLFHAEDISYSVYYMVELILITLRFFILGLNCF